MIRFKIIVNLNTETKIIQNRVGKSKMLKRKIITFIYIHFNTV